MRAAVGIAVFYGAVFAMIGVHLPFWPLWLKSHGLGPKEIGLVVSAGIGIKIIFNPMIAQMADRRGTRRGPVVLLSILSTIAFAGFYWTESFWPILILTLLFFAIWSPIMPLTESLSMIAGRVHGFQYGRVRLWGSLTFIAAAAVGGEVLGEGSEDWIYWMILGCMVAVLATSFLLPDARVDEPASAGRSPFLEVLRDGRFVWFLVATGLIQASHAVYYAFGTLHWQNVGHSERVIGWLWAEGVIAEVFLFIWGAALVERFGAARLIALAGFLGLVRWGLTGLTDSLPALLVLQLLHAFTFAATHLGAIYFIAGRISPSLSATAQSLYSSLAMGLSLAIAAYGSGYLYEAVGGRAYLAMAVMAGLGGVIAFLLRRKRDEGDGPS